MGCGELHLFLSPSFRPSRERGIMRHTRIGATWGDRLLWRAYCTPATGIVSGIQWPGPVSAKHPRLSLLVSTKSPLWLTPVLPPFRFAGLRVPPSAAAIAVNKSTVPLKGFPLIYLYS